MLYIVQGCENEIKLKLVKAPCAHVPSHVHLLPRVVELHILDGQDNSTSQDNSKRQENSKPQDKSTSHDFYPS